MNELEEKVNYEEGTCTCTKKPFRFVFNMLLPKIFYDNTSSKHGFIRMHSLLISNNIAHFIRFIYKWMYVCIDIVFPSVNNILQVIFIALWENLCLIFSYTYGVVAFIKMFIL